MTIALVGNAEDLCATYIKWVALQRGIEILELPEDELGPGWSYSFDDTRPEAGEFTIAGERRPFMSFDGLFVRLFHQPRLPTGVGEVQAEREAIFIVERRAGLQHLLASFPRVVINPPSAGRSNASKPYQMRVLSEAGFAIPRWIASNDRERVAAFVAELPRGAVCKACSGLRSRVRLVGDELLAKLGSSTPIIAQEYIAGRDVRAHTVLDDASRQGPSGRVFATEVRSQSGVDYRFDPGEHEFAAIDMPAELERLCLQVAASEGLVLAGFDFRVTDDDVWYCLEVNPVPTFITYQAATRQEIGEAVVDRLLARLPL